MASKKSNGIGDPAPATFARLTRSPLLSPEEERVLALAARDGCEPSRKKLVEANMRLVVSIARNYANSRAELDDLVQEGAIGLMRSIEGFEPSLGFRFSTYASHWIRQAVSRAQAVKSGTIRLPAHVVQLLRRIHAVRGELAQSLGVEPSDEQVALKTGLSPTRVKHLTEVAQRIVSLDGPSTVAFRVADTEVGRDPVQECLNGALKDEIETAFQTLSARERAVVEARLRRHAGIEEEPAIHEQLSVTRERARQIEQSALKKLRRLAQRRSLGEFLGP